jgi:hypothetical protein
MALREGGLTIHQPSGSQLAICDAAMKYVAIMWARVIFAGEEYGTGSSATAAKERNPRRERSSQKSFSAYTLQPRRHGRAPLPV